MYYRFCNIFVYKNIYIVILYTISMNTKIITKITEPDYEGIVFTEFFQQFGKLATKKLNLINMNWLKENINNTIAKLQKADEQVFN